jgi:hypothetical protein
MRAEQWQIGARMMTPKGADPGGLDQFFPDEEADPSHLSSTAAGGADARSSTSVE